MLYISWINYKIYKVSRDLLDITITMLDVTVSLNNKTRIIEIETKELLKASRAMSEKM